MSVTRSPASPTLRLYPTPGEASRFARAYEAAGQLGDSELRVALGDQLLVRERLLIRVGELDLCDRRAFAEHADRVIELAFHVGIAVALAYAERPTPEIERALAQTKVPAL